LRSRLRLIAAVGKGVLPGLHPKGWEGADRCSPRVLKRFATEAWCLANAGELADEEL